MFPEGPTSKPEEVRHAHMSTYVCITSLQQSFNKYHLSNHYYSKPVNHC